MVLVFQISFHIDKELNCVEMFLLLLLLREFKHFPHITGLHSVIVFINESINDFPVVSYMKLLGITLILAYLFIYSFVSDFHFSCVMRNRSLFSLFHIYMLISIYIYKCVHLFLKCPIFTVCFS
ncbi:conserved hypothetical protein, unlikely [Trypanosoma brucei gambiense DAL972]|uniref:Uncharacterized protein n=2 Tax=Trypanosoma brucei TaxID=5691 RepID=C9ZZ31_TRYB9|nr:conserved hypothetical protein, unlikely [Trypanosoma brucei gambiense DAL972]RHW70554.1 hypothetical protein DPX39_090073200 [Trypanosoma brucei equiperdum]CBH14680.1 conserved hypothetical protein, unlikely [Trypanosoma brucei gambiense DAL972]|eukprot:XP_011776946.1 conserved hypothetical protein, unlikely [Trypanosoma brucei gambiense DAL972]